MYSFTVNNALIEVISPTEVLVGEQVFDNVQSAVDSTKKETFTSAEKALLLLFLDELKEQYYNAGCNDFKIEATPGNIEIANQIMQTNQDSCEIEDNCIYSHDVFWIAYMIEKVRNV